jgi:hypothetical protein
MTVFSLNSVFLTVDTVSVLSAVEMKFYMQFRFRSVSKEMVHKFQGLLFMQPSPFRFNKINPLSLKTTISSQNVHFSLYKEIKIPRSLFKTTVSQHVKCSFSVHLKQKDERPKLWKLLKM